MLLYFKPILFDSYGLNSSKFAAGYSYFPKLSYYYEFTTEGPADGFGSPFDFDFQHKT
jgi:hypothetical protein